LKPTGCNRWARRPSLGKQLPVVEHDIPRPDLPADEDALAVERVAPEQRLGRLGGLGLVDDQRPEAVGERPADGEPAALGGAGEILAVERAEALHLLLVLHVLNDGGVLHGASSAAACGSAAGLVNHAWAPNSTAEKPRSPSSV